MKRAKAPASLAAALAAPVINPDFSTCSWCRRTSSMMHVLLGMRTFAPQLSAVLKLLKMSSPLEPYQHVSREYDSEWLHLDHGVPQRPRCRIHGVAVGGVGDKVDLPALFAQCVGAEADVVVGQALPVVLPVGVAPPAVVDGIFCEAGGRGAVAISPQQHSRLPPVHGFLNPPLDVLDNNYGIRQVMGRVKLGGIEAAATAGAAAK